MLKARIVAVVTAATLAGAIAVGPAIPAQAATVVKAGEKTRSVRRTVPAGCAPRLRAWSVRVTLSRSWRAPA